MKTTIKQYMIICPSCGGAGYISNPVTGTMMTTVCPACQGAKSVLCTETIDESENTNQ